MKKSFIAIFCLSSLFIISCATNNATSTENKFYAPAAENENSADSERLDENESQAEQSENSFDDSFLYDGEFQQNLENNENPNRDDFENSDEFLPSETSENQNENLEPKTEIILQSEIEIPFEREEKSDLKNENDELAEIEEPEVITLEPLPEEIPSESKNEEQIVIEQEIFENDSDEENQNYSQEDDLIFIENDDEDEEQPPLVIESRDDPIDITTDDLPDSLEEIVSESEEKIEKIIPSRSVVLKRQEYVDISYPGRGWIYMGITDGSKDLSYFGRKLGTQDTNFTLQAKNEGTKILHFTKNDPLTNEYINDYIEVKILSEKGSNKTHIQAPQYKMPPTEKSQKIINAGNSENFQNENDLSAENSNRNEKSDLKTDENAAPSQTLRNDDKRENAPVNQSDLTENSSAVNFFEQTATKTENSSSEIAKNENSDPKILLQEAQILYNEKEYALALEKINLFLSKSATNADEALFLQGQCYEAKSDAQDIKAAINSYATLTENYPASKFWDNANKRIIYLKRFYLEAR